MKLLDLVCSFCAHRDEYLLTSEEEKAANIFSSKILEIECSSCKSQNTLCIPEGEVKMSPKHGKNFSWGSWSVGQ